MRWITIAIGAVVWCVTIPVVATLLFGLHAWVSLAVEGLTLCWIPPYVDHIYPWASRQKDA